MNKRLKRERELIDNTSSELLYNPKIIHNFRTKPLVAQCVKILDYVYPSIANAAQMLGESSRNIRQKLDNPRNQEYQRLEYHRHIYFDEYEVKIDEQHFKSTRAVVDSGLAKTTRQVRDRCRSIK